MTEETDTQEYDFSSFPDGFEDDTDETPELDAKLNKVAANQKKMAAKMQAKEDSEEADRMVEEFMGTVPEEHRDVFSVLVSGVQDPRAAKSVIDKLQAKVKAITPAEAAAPDDDEPSSDDDTDDFTPVMAGAPVRPKGREDALMEKVEKTGDMDAFVDLMYPAGSIPGLKR